MAKNKKIVRYRKPFNLNIGFIIFGIIFVYMMFFVFTYFTTTHISVYEVVQGKIAVNNSYTGFILRQEEVYNADASGYINYYTKDASKIGTGDLVYSVDESGSISKQIASANEDSSNLDASNLASIKTRITDYSASYQNAAFYDVYRFKDDLNAEIAEALSMNALNSISDAITAAEGDATFHKSTAQKAGIIVYYTDGFEAVTEENFLEEMLDESSYKKNNLKDKETIDAGAAAYKLITSEDWKIIFPAEKDTINQLGDSKTVRIKFKKDNTVCRASFDIIERDGVTYLSLSLSNSMIRFAAERFIEIELIFDEESGLKIPNSAIAKKDFFTIPMEFFQKGGDSNALGIVVKKADKTGKTTDTFIAPTIYFSTETSYYVDGEDILDGDTVVKPNSSEIYTIHDTGKLDGVYNINKGYAVFKQIDIIYQNEEYSIIRSGTDYGVSLYDHIALDGNTVGQFEMIGEN